MDDLSWRGGSLINSWTFKKLHYKGEAGRSSSQQDLKQQTDRHPVTQTNLFKSMNIVSDT